MITLLAFLLLVFLLLYYCPGVLAAAGLTVAVGLLVVDALALLDHRPAEPLAPPVAESPAPPPRRLGLVREPYVLCRNGEQMVHAPIERIVEAGCVPVWRRADEAAGSEVGRSGSAAPAVAAHSAGGR